MRDYKQDQPQIICVLRGEMQQYMSELSCKIESALRIFPFPFTLTRQPFWPRSDCVCYKSSCSDMFLHSSVCACLRHSGWQTRSLCVAHCSVSPKDKQWRVERVICLLGLSSSPWSPTGLSPLRAALFWRWRSFLSAHASVLGDGVDRRSVIFALLIYTPDTLTHTKKRVRLVFH